MPDRPTLGERAGAWWRRLTSFVKNHRAVSAVFVLAFVVAGFVVAGNGAEAPTYEAVFAQRGTIEHVVSVTGRVEPARRAQLSFPSAGRVSVVRARVGERVVRGQTLMSQDTSVRAAERAEIAADLEEARASLEELVRGARQEDVAVSQASVDKAEVELARAREDVEGVIERAYQLADDALRNEIDQLYDNPLTDPEFGVTITSSGVTFEIRGSNEERLALHRARRQARERMSAWEAMLEEREPEETGVRAKRAQEHLAFLQNFFRDVAEIVNALSPDSSAGQTLYASYKADVASARSTISALLRELREAHETYDTRDAALAVANRELALKRAEPTVEEIEIVRARVARAQASLARIDAQLQDARLRAPFAGVVTEVPVEAGEVLASGQTALVMMSSGAFELVADIPEADIARVTIGDNAEVTLDAYERDEIFAAEVIDIAPAEKLLEGVPTYETTLVFSQEDSRIKSGMTADIEILTDRAPDTIFVPQRSVIRTGERTYVRVVEDGEIIERDVTIGLRGSNGTIEITEGLEEGEQVVLFIEDE